MKRIGKENQYSGGKRNFEEERRPRLNYRRTGRKATELNRDGTEPNNYEDRGRNENNNFQPRPNLTGSRTNEIQSNRPRMQQDNNRSKKIDSVKAEMEIRAKGNNARERTTNRNGERESEE